VTPCDHSNNTDPKESTHISQQDNHHKQHDDSELCSPFCLDENCHINIVYQVVEEFNFQLTTDFYNSFAYAESKGYEIRYSIFQPPRL
jgi:hypothetical protein